MRYTQKDTILALKNSGILKGDTVFFTTGLGFLGIPDIEEVSSIDSICLFMLNSIKTVLGTKGTILIPTYSYTFGSNKKHKLPIFDPQKTDSMIGPFSNFFIKQNGVIRSHDPMISIAGLGPKSKEILNNTPPTSYGKGCIFERILKIKNAKYCNIGLGVNWIPFIHYVDWLNKAPFRYDKFFKGYILKGKKKNIVKWHYPVRILRKESIANGHKIGKLAYKNGMYKRCILGRSTIYTANYKKIFNFIIKLTKFDPWLTVNGPKFKTNSK